MMQFFEIEQERGAEFVRRRLGHQHRLALERRAELDDQPRPCVVGGAQPIECVARRSEHRIVDHEPFCGGPRRSDDAAGFDHEVTPEPIGAGTGDGDPSLEWSRRRPRSRAR